MKTVGKNFVINPGSRIFLLILSGLFIMACEKESTELIDSADRKAKSHDMSGSFEFAGSVYDIASTPDGNILVGVNNEGSKSIQIIKNGEVSTMTEIDAPTDIHGIAALGAGNAFVTTAGSDLAMNGELYRVSPGNVRMVADLAAFERENDPDAFEGLQWKNQLCEEDPVQNFSAGPQNNPYKVAALSGGTALVADAAGNTVLSATTSGDVNWKAVFSPPTENGDFIVLKETLDGEEVITCYVQPVPTSVAIGPDGYIYVGELTGALSEGLPTELSRVWKLPADGMNMVCTESSGDCQVIIDGLTSVIDLAIGPDGLLYVVEFDESSWLASFIPGIAQGGTISVYDLEGNFIDVIASGLSFPSAITFDKQGNLWVLENNNIALPDRTPTVRLLTTI